MRILLINYEYPPVGGGASNATWEIARAMVRLGHEPVVLTARYKHRQPARENPGIKVIQVAAIRRRKDRCSIWEMTTFVLSASWSIRKILRQEKIEGMIAFFSIPCGPIAWWGWRKTKIPYIVSLRGGDVPGNERGLGVFHGIFASLRRVIFQNATAIIANSTGLKTAAEIADKFPVQVIPNGVDKDFWVAPSHRVCPPPFRFLFVGRFQSQKNLFWLFAQLPSIAQANAPGSWELHLVGDGALKEELLRHGTKLGIDRHLYWHGWLGRCELRAIYQTSHCLVIPSIYEGMPNVVLEALACGLQALISTSAADGDSIFSNQSVRQFDLSNPNSFITNVSDLLKRTAVLSSNSESILSWQNVAETYLNKFLDTKIYRSFKRTS